MSNTSKLNENFSKNIFTQKKKRSSHDYYGHTKTSSFFLWLSTIIFRFSPSPSSPFHLQNGGIL